MRRGIVIPVLVMLVFLAACSEKPKDYNIVLISLDTTRGDYVDTGMGARAFTPALRRFAMRSLTFERAFCTIPQTLPSHLSVFTSRLPHECGVYSNEYPYDGRHKMLQQELKERGYATAAVISLGTLNSTTGFSGGFDEFRENLNDKHRFFVPAQKVTDEGLKVLKKNRKNRFFLFLHYSDPHSPYAAPTAKSNFKIEVDGRTEAEFNAYEGAILRKHIELSGGIHHIRFKIEDWAQNFDAYVIRHLKFSKNCQVSFENIEFSPKHYNGAHILRAEEGCIRVHCRGKGFIKIFQTIPLLTWNAVLENYRKEVEYMDRHVGKFLRALEEEKLLKKTIVVIFGDHGEGLGERDRYFGHVRYLNQQFIRVPLIMHLPGIRPKRLPMPVSLLGISPTVLEFIGYRDTGFNHDESLLKRIKTGSPGNSPGFVYSFAFSPSAVENKFSVIKWPYQHIFIRDNTDTAENEIYHLALSQSFRKLDAFSPRVIIRRDRKEYLGIQRVFNRWKGVLGRYRIAGVEIHREKIEQLRTMGYFR